MIHQFNCTQLEPSLYFKSSKGAINLLESAHPKHVEVLCSIRSIHSYLRGCYCRTCDYYTIIIIRALDHYTISLRACLVTSEESIDLMILHYYWKKDSLLGICIVEDLTLILVCIDAYS